MSSLLSELRGLSQNGLSSLHPNAVLQGWTGPEGPEGPEPAALDLTHQILPRYVLETLWPLCADWDIANL